MPWDLEIHQLDVGTSGDCTVIVARFREQVGTVPLHTRTVLIDGGKRESAAIIAGYLREIGITRVDVVCVTHYDTDHYMGVAELLTSHGPLFEHAILFDPGWPTDRQSNGEFVIYDDAIRNSPCQSVTENTNSWHLAHFDVNGATTYTDPRWFEPVHPFPAGLYRDLVWPEAASDGIVWHPPYWLIGQDVMWGTPDWEAVEANGNSSPEQRPILGVDQAPLLHDRAPNNAPNPPRLRCIAANMYVARDSSNGGPPVEFVPDQTLPQNDGDEIMLMGPTALGKSAGGIKNQKSLGFMVEFNHFRFYTAGDLENKQEEGWDYSYQGVTYHRHQGLRAYLNPDQALARRVWAFKPSHHGAQTATPRDFVDALIPAVAFISCSNNNAYLHPKPRTINVLDGHGHEPINSRWRWGYRDGVDRINPGKAKGEKEHTGPSFPPPALQAPVFHYLTGYQWPSANPPRAKYGRLGTAAGDGTWNRPGHLRLAVSEIQSRRSREGAKYWAMAATLAAFAEGLAPDVDWSQTAVDLAETGVRFGGAAAATLAAGGTLDQWFAAQTVVAHVGDRAKLDPDEEPIGLVSGAIGAISGGAGLMEVIDLLRTQISVMPHRLKMDSKVGDAPLWLENWSTGIEDRLAVAIGSALIGTAAFLPYDQIEAVLEASGYTLDDPLRAALLVGSADLIRFEDRIAAASAAALGAAGCVGALRAGADIPVGMIIGAIIRCQCLNLPAMLTARVTVVAGVLGDMSSQQQAIVATAAGLGELQEPVMQNLMEVVGGVLAEAEFPEIDGILAQLHHRIASLTDTDNLLARFTVGRLPPEPPTEQEGLPDIWQMAKDTGQMRELITLIGSESSQFFLGRTPQALPPGQVDVDPYYC